MNLNTLKDKQSKILNLLLKCGENKYKIKACSDLSPIGWHILHCVYIETFWIQKYFFNDKVLSDRLQEKFDADNIKIINRGKNLPKFLDIVKFAKQSFLNNRSDLIRISENKKINKKISVNYIYNFLIHHHSQHIETMYMILNMINFNYNKNYKKYMAEINAREYVFDAIDVKKKSFFVGSDLNDFSYDNEKPKYNINIKSFKISRDLITLGQWKAFIEDGGYKKKQYWSKKAWIWKENNNVEYPLNWKTYKNKIALSTPYGFISPSESYPVTNISKYELEAFAKWSYLEIPHEHQWEVSAKTLKRKFKVWQWCCNKFFPYDGFEAFPYKEYSSPWFNNKYFTLKGASDYSESQIKRFSFRNFYKPEDRYIFAGGRLIKSL